ncbi:MAG: hypothetical protein IJJ63_01815 [Bacilli bacterium]|nr:hypothetical protein [Bacilli bacterium]
MNSQISPADQHSDIFRGIFSFFDRPAYWLLTIIYQIFFNVASADLFANETIMNFFGRVQLIIGVYMMFQLAMTILKGIVNPDSFMDSKSGGSNIIYRIAVALIMLTLLIPFRTGGSNQLEKQISNNGILFGTLYDLQHRILENNTIGRLVLGSNATTSFFSEDEDASKSEEEKIAKSARVFSSTILKGFYRINLLPEDQWPTSHDYDVDDPAIFNDVRVCATIDDIVLQTYTKKDVDPSEIIDMVKLTCKADPKINPLNTLNPGDNFYIFAYTGVVSMIVGFAFAAILLSFTIDVAVRGVKLAVLRLLAPIPIISYMDPKGGKDGAFNSWVKTLTSTYIDLFIRLAVVYFVIFLIQDMIDSGVVIKHGVGTLGIISWILLWVGLFVFAKQSPAFIKSVLGIKGDSKFGLFSGLGEALGVGAIAAGAFSSTVAGARASWAADDHNGHSHLNPINLLKNAGSGIVGGITGAGTGIKAFGGAKGNSMSAVSSAINARNSKLLSSGYSGGTFLGGVGSTVRTALTGESSYDALNRGFKKEEEEIKNAQAALKPLQDINAHRKAIMDRATSKAVDDIRTVGTYNGITGNYRDYHSAYVAAKSGSGVLHDAAGDYFEFNGQRIDMAQAYSVDIGLREENAKNFYHQAYTDRTFDSTIASALAALESSKDPHATVQTDFGALKGAYGDLQTEISKRSDKINERSNDLSKERAAKGSKAQANSTRFGGGGGKNGG